MRVGKQRDTRVPDPPRADAPPREAVLVTGLPGSGKTTLVNCSHFPTDLAAPITFSDLMEEVLQEEFDGARPEMLWPATRERVQRRAAERLAAFRPDRLLVIDGHLVVPTERGWERGVPSEVWGMVSMVAIVVVHVPAHEMAARGPVEARMAGATREELIEEFTIRQSIVRSTVAYYAASLNRRPGHAGRVVGQGCALHWITNSEGRQAAAELELANYIRLVAQR